MRSAHGDVKTTRRPDGPPTILGIRKHVPGSGLGEMGRKHVFFLAGKKHTHTHKMITNEA